MPDFPGSYHHYSAYVPTQQETGRTEKNTDPPPPYTPPNHGTGNVNFGAYAPHDMSNRMGGLNLSPQTQMKIDSIMDGFKQQISRLGDELTQLLGSMQRPMFSQPYHQSYNHPYNQPHNHPYNQPHNHPYNQPHNQSYNEPYNQQSFNHPVNNPYEGQAQGGPYHPSFGGFNQPPLFGGFHPPGMGGGGFVKPLAAAAGGAAVGIGIASLFGGMFGGGGGFGGGMFATDMGAMACGATGMPVQLSYLL